MEKTYYVTGDEYRTWYNFPEFELCVDKNLPDEERVDRLAEQFRKEQERQSAWFAEIVAKIDPYGLRL